MAQDFTSFLMSQKPKDELASAPLSQPFGSFALSRMGGAPLQTARPPVSGLTQPMGVSPTAPVAAPLTKPPAPNPMGLTQAATVRPNAPIAAPLNIAKPQAAPGLVQAATVRPDAPILAPMGTPRPPAPAIPDRPAGSVSARFAEFARQRQAARDQAKAGG